MLLHQLLILPYSRQETAVSVRDLSYSPLVKTDSLPSPLLYTASKFAEPPSYRIKLGQERQLAVAAAAAAAAHQQRRRRRRRYGICMQQAGQFVLWRVFYIKPNFPGRCSHACGGDSITDPGRRGRKAGLIDHALWRLEKDLGYRASYLTQVRAARG